MLGSNDNRRRRVPRKLAREDASIQNKHVVRAIHFRIGIDDRRAPGRPVIGAHLGSAHPVVRAAPVGRDEQRVDVRLGRLVRPGPHPLEPGDPPQRLLDALYAGHDSQPVIVVVQKGLRADRHRQAARDGRAAPGDLAAAQVLRDGHCVRRVCEGAVALDARGPLQLARDAVGAGDLLPEHGADVGRRLGEDPRAVAEVGLLVRLDWLVPGGVEVVEDYVWVGDYHVGLVEGFG